MANRILVSVEDGLTSPSWTDKASDFCERVLLECGYDGEEVSVFFCTDLFIKNLNSEYRNIDSETDVLSFENGEEFTDEDGSTWISAGDIVISLETLPKNSSYFEVSEDEELKRLLVHGLLHLNGYDHGEEHIEKGREPECEMLKIQKKLMTTFSDFHILNT